MKIRFLITLLFITILCNFSINAQKGFSFHLGGAFPIGDFADNDFDEEFYEEKNSGAGIGINAGIKYVYLFNENGLGLFTGIDFIINPLAKDVKNDIEESYEETDILGINEIHLTSEIKYKSYYNIPISTGFYLQKPIDERIIFFGQAGLMYNLFKITPYELEYSSNSFYISENATYDTKQRTEYDLSKKFGMKLSCGLAFDNNLFMELNYFNMGEHDVDAKLNIKSDITTNSDTFQEEIEFDFEQELAVNIIALTIGYKF